MDQGEKEIMQDRDKLIMEWMRSNESFKALARKYGKGGKITRLDDEDAQEWEEGLSAKVGALIDPEAGPAAATTPSTQPDQWLKSDESFKALAKKYGYTPGTPKPNGS